MQKETVKYVVYLGGKECPTFPIYSIEGEKFSQLSSLKEDLNFSKDCLSILLTKDISHISFIQPFERPSEDLTIIFSLFKSAIVSYARCFNSSDAKRIQLSTQLFKSDADINNHQEMIDLTSVLDNWA